MRLALRVLIPTERPAGTFLQAVFGGFYGPFPCAGPQIDQLVDRWKKPASDPSSVGQIPTTRPLACFGKQLREQARVLSYSFREAPNCDLTLCDFVYIN